jgi:hypothetical protein
VGLQHWGTTSAQTHYRDDAIDQTNLGPWIEQLRAQWQAGAFADRGPLWLGNEVTLKTAHGGIGRLLGDVDYFTAMAPEERRKPHMVARRHRCANLLARLRAVLNGTAPWLEQG